MMINENSVNFLSSTLDEIINDDTNTTTQDIMREINSYLNKYNIKNRGERGLDMSYLIELNARSTEKPSRGLYIRKTFLDVIRKNKKEVFKFIINIGFDKNYFEYYKNHEPL